MSTWGPTTYGDPCSRCRFSWSVPKAEAVATVAATPTALRELLAGADGSERHPDLAWPVVGYVCHVSDNLRIWAERLAGLAAGDRRPVPRYDQDLLARARGYPEVSLAGALWSLDRAVADWTDALHRADTVVAAGAGAITLVHPDRGAQSLLDVVRSNAHDAWHHRDDIARTIDATRGGRG